MSKPATRLLQLASQVDWPRVLHMGGTLMRELRGDAPEAIAGDAEKAASAGTRTLGIFEQLARAAAGCRGTEDCGCAFCAERKQQP